MYVTVVSPYPWDRGATRSPIYHYNDDYEDGGISYDRKRRFVNSNPSRRSRFLDSNRRSRFSNSTRDKGGGYSNLDEFRIPSFDESHDVELTLL